METATTEPPPLPPADDDTEASNLRLSKRRRRRFIIRAAGILVVGSLTLAVLLHASLLIFLSRKTPDYVQVGANNIYMLERTLHHPDLDQEVILMGMAHIGDQDFYDAIERRLDGNGLILWEGVTDRQQLLGGGTAHPYGELSNALGLAQQQRFDQPAEKMVWADVDVAELDPESLEVLNLLFGMMAAIDDRTEVRRRLKEFGEMEAENPGIEKRLMTDLIDTRNDRLLEVIADHDHADRLFVPWGAWHMPGVEEALRDRGFTVVDETRRPLTAMTRVYGSACKALLFGLRSDNGQEH